MQPLRRSQRLRARQFGQQNEDGQGEQQEKKGKRELESQDVGPKRYRLTAKNLGELQRQQQRMGRLRKVPSSPGGARSTTRSTTTTVTSARASSITTTDRQFGPTLLRNGVIFEEFRTIAPGDLKEVEIALSEERPLPAAALEHLEDIRLAREQMSYNKLSLESKIIESMLIHQRRRGYLRQLNTQWTEIDNEITVGISDPKPDVVEAYLWSQYPPGSQDEFVELTPTQYGFVMPSFAVESRESGDAEQALKQAAYDGAVMTCAAIAAERRMGKSDGDLYFKTKAITVTVSRTDICVFANHAVKEQLSGQITYHQHCVERIRFAVSEATWKKAYSIMYNAQAFALRLQDARIEDIKKYMQERQAALKEMKDKHGHNQADPKVKAGGNMAPPPPKRIAKNGGRPLKGDAAKVATGKPEPSISNNPSHIDPVVKLDKEEPEITFSKFGTKSTTATPSE